MCRVHVCMASTGEKAKHTRVQFVIIPRSHDGVKWNSQWIELEKALSKLTLPSLDRRSVIVLIRVYDFGESERFQSLICLSRHHSSLEVWGI